MPIDNFEIVGSYNNQRFPNIDAERSINLFEYIDPKAKKPRSLLSTSGLLNTGILFPAAIGGFRGEFVLANIDGTLYEYLVIGQDIYRRDVNNIIVHLNSGTGPFGPLGPLDTLTGFIGIDANNNPNGPQILFVDGKKGYVWDTATEVFTPDLHAVDPNFPLLPIDVCFLDGFLVVAAGNTNTFQLSALNNVYSWGLVSISFTGDSGTNILTLGGATGFITGQPVQVDIGSGGVLPTGLTAITTYYAIVIDSLHIKLANSLANALLGTAIPLVTNGTPPIVVTNIGQLQLGAINSHPGVIVSCRTLHRRLFLFSANYTEVWENAGAGTNLPFRRNNGALMEVGTPAQGSIVTGFDKMIFLSQDKDGLGSVMEVIGTQPIPISNRALDFQLAQYAQAGQISDARGIFIKENGIIFYRLNFTAANHTFVYDVTLSDPQTEEGRLWHEEEVLNGDRHPAQTHGYFNGNNYYGSYDSTILYQVDQSFTTNDGEIIPRIRIGRCYVPSTYNRTRIDRFSLDVIQGLTNVVNLSGVLDLLTESGNIIDTESGLDILLEESSMTPILDPSNQTIFLSYSKDGGVTYGYRQNGYVGGTGLRQFRTVWRKLGVVPRGQGFVPKIEFYSNVPLIILGAAWFFEVLPQ